MQAVGALSQTRSSSCLAAGYFRVAVVTFGGGNVQAVAVFKATALHLGSGCGL